MSVDVSDEAQLDAAIAEHDLVISLIPYTHHATVIKSAVKHKKHVVTTSYVSPAMMEYDQQCKDAGVVCLNEVGLDPGIDHFYALKTIDEVHREGGKIKSFVSFCGGLPAPEASNNPLGYKFSWSARGVLMALMNDAKFWENGQIVNIAGKDLMKSAKPIFVYPAFALVGYPNRDSSIYKERYNIPEAQTVIRGTLRFQGFPEFVKALVDIGFLDTTEQEFLSKSSTEPLTWNVLTARLVGANPANAGELLAAVSARIQTNDQELRERIIHGIHWLGITSSTIQVAKRGTYLDTLCARLEELMMYGPGERDMVILQHKFGVENADGTNEVRTSTLVDYGFPNGYTSMARTVGIPCGIATQMILDGKISTAGVLAPMTPDIYVPIMDALVGENIYCVEEKF
ncbi:Saccharopine dehydrogenase [NADP(+), L-glutamate-forming] [Zancudomyces culisetae]|uniref:Saccharopine dehydrogenase [NADP(+), L-glutamate-forming] n=1 Tax=Zancudomyces culisetae TaxID=1213189 RepID=A0A1R1PSQ1_ZANCU|nr:Saccharopine dehydrogenase [NADP(+), L-glutamate-forming] [Zancudomyces culisetae]|eukprot:OMH83912.1 Saccharopine dehydrogenase [NADP(+), L-glutamate-forming] [Zancudomyces culisetae]